MTKKKITRVEGAEESVAAGKKFVASDEAKGRARRNRTIAIVVWVIALVMEGRAIYLILNPPINMTYLLILIGIALAGTIVGSILWKKANRLDPASEKEKFRFFVQNQLGAIISAIAFLPLLIVVLTNKDLDKKQKGILGGVVGVALVVATIVGIDFNPPSQEQYAEQIEQVKSLNGGNDFVYWTKFGKSYHLYNSCSYINSKRTTEIFEGGVAQARELKNITDLCDRCERQARRENEIVEPVNTEEVEVDQGDEEQIEEQEVSNE